MTTSTPRVTRSRDKLRESGGLVTSVRLSPEGHRRLLALMEAEGLRYRNDAIELALERAATEPAPD